MENSANNSSTHEESSKMPNDDEQNNIYQGRVTRTTLAPNASRQKSKENFISVEEENNHKNNETLPIKGTIVTFNFKIVFIGNASVGKSSIIKRFVHNEFNKKYLCTIGTELSKKTILIGDNKKVNLFIWDTCGQEKFRTVTRQYYRDTQAILLVFDLTNEKSFKDLDSWFEEAINYINNSKCLFFVFGNKSDESDKIVINNQQIKTFLANKSNSKIKKYFEVSAFNGHNIDLAFDKICQHLLMKFGGNEINKNMKQYKKNLKLEDNDNKNKKEDVGCC